MPWDLIGCDSDTKQGTIGLITVSDLLVNVLGLTALYLLLLITIGDCVKFLRKFFHCASHGNLGIWPHYRINLRDLSGTGRELCWSLKDEVRIPRLWFGFYDHQRRCWKLPAPMSSIMTDQRQDRVDTIKIRVDEWYCRKLLIFTIWKEVADAHSDTSLILGNDSGPFHLRISGIDKLNNRRSAKQKNWLKWE